MAERRVIKDYKIVRIDTFKGGDCTDITELSHEGYDLYGPPIPTEHGYIFKQAMVLYEKPKPLKPLGSR
jgi:hypothetical protein